MTHAVVHVSFCWLPLYRSDKLRTSLIKEHVISLSTSSYTNTVNVGQHLQA